MDKSIKTPSDKEESLTEPEVLDGNPEVSEEKAEEVLTEETVESLQEKLAESEERALRARADFLNYQRRALERESVVKEQAMSDLVRELLTAFDQFDIAMSQGTDVDPVKLVDGIRMAYEEFQASLQKAGIETIRPSPGDLFDPHCHEAISKLPHEELEVGVISETYSSGYRAGTLLVRPAKVCVVGEES